MSERKREGETFRKRDAETGERARESEKAREIQRERMRSKEGEGEIEKANVNKV